MQISWGNLAPHASHFFGTSKEDQAHVLLKAMAGLQEKKTQATVTGFEDGREPSTKECGQPPEAEKGKGKDSPSISRWNAALPIP